MPMLSNKAENTVFDSNSPLPGADGVSSSEKKPLEVKAAEEGAIEAVKEAMKLEFTNKQKFNELLNRSKKVLLKISNIIPLLTSDVIIDINKVDIIHRFFFFSGRNHSIAIKDITDVFTETIPFLGTLNIVDEGFAENTVRVRWLKKKEAEKARRIITGLMEARKEEVDITKLDDKNLASKFEELGKIREARPV